MPLMVDWEAWKRDSEERVSERITEGISQKVRELSDNCERIVQAKWQSGVVSDAEIERMDG